jgi:hypothetical protein
MPWVPLDFSNSRVNHFLFESFVQILAGKMRFSIDLNLNALANAPTLSAALMEAMTL